MPDEIIGELWQIKDDMARDHGHEARVAKVEGEVQHIARRLDSMGNWLRVIVGLQVATPIAVIAAMIRLAA